MLQKLEFEKLPYVSKPTPRYAPVRPGAASHLA
jgi:hypothetical protein